MGSIPVDNVLIDIGGVLTVDPWESILLSPGVGLADRLGLDREAVVDAGRTLWQFHSHRTTEEFFYWEQMSDMLGVRLVPRMIREVEADVLVVNPDASDLLAGITASRRSWGLISDNTAFWYRKQLALLGLSMGELKWEFTSFGLGVTKNDLGLGLYECAAGSVAPARTVVIDDRMTNIKRARRCGFLARQYAIGDEESLVDLIEGEVDCNGT